MVDKKSNQVIYCTVEEKEYLKKELEKYRLKKKADELGLSISESDSVSASTVNTSTSDILLRGINGLLGSSESTPREYFFLAMCVAKGNTRSSVDWGRLQHEVNDMPEEKDKNNSYEHYLTREERAQIETLTTELFGPASKVEEEKPKPKVKTNPFFKKKQ